MIDVASLIYGTVFQVEFPHSDDPTSADLRPAVVVSNETFNSIWAEKKVVGAFITTQKPKPLNQYHIFIGRGTSEYVDSGLRFPSYIRLDKFMTFDVSAVKGYYGRFSEEFMKEKRIEELCKTIF